MKRVILCIGLLAAVLPARAYYDHRGHNLDSLEMAVASWTPDKVARASEEELSPLVRAYRDLMLGYEVLNAEKSVYYARKAKEISDKKGWPAAAADADRHIGQYFWAKEQYDSAMVYMKEALYMTELMAGGATTITNPNGYSELVIDDALSSTYGAIGNLYNTMDSIPRAMEYYAKAGAIFDKHGWNESNSILYYNIGNTWQDKGDYKASMLVFRKALAFAREAGDSLLVAYALSGMGSWYADKGKTRKALKYLREADTYYASHADQEFRSRLENLELQSRLFREQKERMAKWIIALIALVGIAIAATVLLRRRKRQESHEVHDAPASEVKLNDREIQILRLMAEGKTTAAIAEAIFLSPETVKWYRKRLFTKFNVSNASELIRRVTEDHII